VQPSATAADWSAGCQPPVTSRYEELKARQERRKADQQNQFDDPDVQWWQQFGAEYKRLAEQDHLVEHVKEERLHQLHL
jgi:hypothetical protein